MFMVRYFYESNISGSSWKTMFADTLRHMDFVPIVTDLDVYCRWARKPNCEECYELLQDYVDDAVCCSRNPKVIMYVIDLNYDLKEGLVGPSMIYLGTKIKKYEVKTGTSHWSI